jgi:hypothetical protein
MAVKVLTGLKCFCRIQGKCFLNGVRYIKCMVSSKPFEQDFRFLVENCGR